MAITKVTYSMINGDIVNALDYGASPSASATVNTAAIQAALNTGNLVFLPKGVYQTNAALVLNENSSGIVGENFGYGGAMGSVIDYTGTDAAIKIAGTSSHQLTALSVGRIGIAVRSASAKGIDFTEASYCSFRDIWIRLYSSNASGVYGKGNSLGSAPYYNIFDNVQVFGQTDGVTVTGQRGYFFEGDGAGNLADGPNANTVTNVGRLAGLEVGFDIHSGNGNMFSNISMESIRSYGFKIGYGTGAAGRADGNIGTNIRVEGSNSCVFAKFDGQASSNVFTNYFATSISTVLFTNNAGYSNFCKPSGVFYVANFYGKNIPANTTTKLDPEWTGAEGGITVPVSSVPYAMIVTVNRFASGGAGSGVVNFYRSNIANPNLTFTVNDANRFGGRTINTAPDVSQAYNSFDGVNGAAQVEIVTDASWDQTGADVQVQVVFLG